MRRPATRFEDLVVWQKAHQFVLAAYRHAAMRRATYEILSNGTFYGEIPGFEGMWSNGATLEACREELQEVLEGWILLGLRMGHTLPIAEGITLATQLEPA